MKETVGFTVRIPVDLQQTARFIAAHKRMSMNALIVEGLRQLVSTTHVELPSDLLLAEKGSGKEN
jgi:hypothetical protein